MGGGSLSGSTLSSHSLENGVVRPLSTARNRLTRLCWSKGHSRDGLKSRIRECITYVLIARGMQVVSELGLGAKPARHDAGVRDKRTVALLPVEPIGDERDVAL